MSSDVLSELLKVHNDVHNSWTCDSLKLEVYETLHSEAPIEINLADLPECGSNALPVIPKNLEMFYWFDKQYDSLEKSLYGMLNLACCPCGFQVQSNSGPVPLNTSFCKVYECTHRRILNDNHIKKKQLENTANPKKQRNGSTARAKTSEDKCTFKITVYFSREHKRWYMHRDARHMCLDHVKHAQLSPKVVPLRKAALSKEVLDLVHDTLKLNFCTSNIQQLVDREGQPLTGNQIRELRDNLRMGSGTSKKSPAQLLVDSLDVHEGIRYIYMTARRDRGSDMITIRKTTREGTQQSTPTSKSSSQETCTGYAARVLTALELNEGQDMLVGVAWTTEKARGHFAKHPELIGTDLTFGTQKEKRPLGRFVGRNGGGKNLPLVDAILPSGATWVHEWLWCQALPHLLSSESLAKVQVVTTDQDPQSLDAIEAAIRNNVIPLAKIRLCSWHKVNRNYEQEVKCWTREKCKRSSVNTIFTTVVTKFLYHFSDYVECEEEERLSMEMLEDFINTFEGISKELRDFTLTFVRQRFACLLHRLSFRHFMGRPNGFVKANSFVESENATLKRKGGNGPRSNQSIDISVTATIQHTAARYEKLDANNLKSMQCQSTNTEHPELYDALQPAVCNNLLQQYAQRESYKHHKINDTTFLVRRWEWKPLTKDATKKEVYNYFVPAYDRVREVSIDRTSERMSCTCKLFKRKRIACRHIFAVLSRAPRKADAGIQGHKVYEVQDTQDDRVSRLMEKEMESPTVFPRLDDENDLDTQRHTNLDWFENNREKCLLRPGQYYTDYVSELNRERATSDFRVRPMPGVEVHASQEPDETNSYDSNSFGGHDCGDEDTGDEDTGDEDTGDGDTGDHNGGSLFQSDALLQNGKEIERRFNEIYGMPTQEQNKKLKESYLSRMTPIHRRIADLANHCPEWLTVYSERMNETVEMLMMNYIRKGQGKQNGESDLVSSNLEFRQPVMVKRRPGSPKRSRKKRRKVRQADEPAAQPAVAQPTGRTQSVFSTRSTLMLKEIRKRNQEKEVDRRKMMAKRKQDEMQEAASKAAEAEAEEEQIEKTSLRMNKSVEKRHTLGGTTKLLERNVKKFGKLTKSKGKTSNEIWTSADTTYQVGQRQPKRKYASSSDDSSEELDSLPLSQLVGLAGCEHQTGKSRQQEESAVALRRNIDETLQRDIAEHTKNYSVHQGSDGLSGGALWGYLSRKQSAFPELICKTCKGCQSAAEELSVPYYKKDSLLAYRNTETWFTRQICWGFGRLVFHLKHPMGKIFFGCIGLNNSGMPLDDMGKPAHINADVNTVLAGALGRNHFVLLDLDIKKRCISVVDGKKNPIPIPLESWKKHSLLLLKQLMLVEPGAQVSCIVIGEEDFHCHAKSSTKWRLRYHNEFVEQEEDDNYSCGPILCYHLLRHAMGWQLKQPQDMLKLREIMIDLYIAMMEGMGEEVSLHLKKRDWYGLGADDEVGILKGQETNQVLSADGEVLDEFNPNRVVKVEREEAVDDRAGSDESQLKIPPSINPTLGS